METYTFAVNGQMQTSQRSPTLTIPESGSTLTATTRDADASAGCTTTATVSGDKATFQPKQACGSGLSTTTLTSGNATVSGNTLAFGFSFDIRTTDGGTVGSGT